MNKEFVNKLIVITLAGALLFYLVRDYNKKKQVKVVTEPFDNSDSELLKDTSVDVVGSEENKNEKFRAVDFESKQFQNDCFPRDKLTSEDLLPKDASNKLWSQVNPAGSGAVSDGNFLNAGHHYGVNTIGSSLRNANLSIRSEPINPQEMVSPWLNTTISPDLNRKPLEIGESTC